jgi:hypothetical protein
MAFIPQSQKVIQTKEWKAHSSYWPIAILKSIQIHVRASYFGGKHGFSTYQNIIYSANIKSHLQIFLNRLSLHWTVSQNIVERHY